MPLQHFVEDEVLQAAPLPAEFVIEPLGLRRRRALAVVDPPAAPGRGLRPGRDGRPLPGGAGGAADVREGDLAPLAYLDDGP